MANLVYTVALVQDGDRLKSLHWHLNLDKAFENDRIHLNKLKEVEETIETYGDCKCLFYLNTEDRASMLSARIKCECAELRDVVKHHNDLLTYHNGSIVINQTYDICCEIQKGYMERIGRLVRRLLERCDNGKEVFRREVKDEIALQCYDLICKQDEARKQYEKMDHDLNDRYYRSKVNAYC